MKNLSDEARKLRNAYQRNWLKRNPEKARKYQIDYWERKAAEYSPIVKAKELYEKGLSQRKIAEELGISLGTVNGYLNKRRT